MTAYQQNNLREGNELIYCSYQQAYQRLTGQYLNMHEEAQTFRGYAARASKIYHHENPGYEVIIDKQAKKIVKKCQEYLHERRMKYHK